jgi:predicted transcriptional regulator
LSPGEFEVMELFWCHGPQNSREVYEKLHATRALAYTTVMTFIEKLQRKGFILQPEKGKGSRYFPQIERREALQRCLDFFIRSYFGGQVPHLLDFLGDEIPQPLPASPSRELKKTVPEKTEDVVSVFPGPTMDTELL